MQKKVLHFFIGLAFLVGCNDKPEVQPDHNSILTVYPNPASQVVYIAVDQEVDQPFTLRVFNTKGALIREEKGTRGPQYFSINLNNENTGEFQAILQSQNIRVTHKIIKLR